MELVAQSNHEHQNDGKKGRFYLFSTAPSKCAPYQSAENKVLDDVTGFPADDMEEAHLFRREKGKKKLQYGNDNPRGSCAGERIGGEDENDENPNQRKNPTAPGCTSTVGR